jgi:carbohydrate-selective porin OprB
VPALAVDYVEADTVTKTQDVTPRDEYVIDTSYKFQLLKKLSLLPDVQLMLDPANNPDKDSIWMVGLRGILTL